MFKRVLVATDFSRHADRVLECIGEIPGMEEISFLMPEPKAVNIGYIKSWVEREVSLTMFLKTSLPRIRLALYSG